MAFTSLKLTTFGQNLDAKCKQGKGLHLSRVAIGDGLLGNGSMINRTALVSERFSMLIDAKQLTDEGAVAAIISTLDNSSFTEGFPYRELGLMGVDPDTSQEGLYLYDNAGEECEYLDTQANGVIVYERLKLLIKTEETDQITFNASGNPLYIGVDDPVSSNTVTFTEAETRTSPASGDTQATLWGKVRKLFTDLESNAFKFAGLDDSGKVPSAQLPSYVDDVLEYANLAAFPASGETGKIYVALDTNKTYRWSGSAYVEISQSLALGETSSSAYRGDRGKTAYDHSQTTGNPHGTTAEQAGAATKPVIVTVTFTVAGWVHNATTGCYEQSVACAGLLATDGKNVRVEPVGNTDAAAQALTDAAFAMIDRVACNTDGYLYARCPDGAPTVQFQADAVISR